MGKCCICHSEIDTDTAPILYMGATGVPRCVCEECDRDIEGMTKGRECDKISDACRSLAARLDAAECEDERTVLLISGMMKAAKERAEKIEAGEWDFEAEEKQAAAEDEFDITEDLMETEEDRALDAHDAKVNKIFDTVSTWVMGLAIVGAVVFFILKFVFHVI
ncbi:MAG: hypothetical protein IKD45_04730 [Clostridia bacterium]|nr:hypothetical protein [Clostridia bacterium]